MTRTEPWCHACARAMQSQQHLDVNAWTCAGCGGVFLPHVQEQDMQLPTTAAALRPVLRDQVACPWCDQVMGRATIDGVEIDRCVTCGTWLDHGELARLLDGGVDAVDAPREPRRQRNVLEEWLGSGSLLDVLLRGNVGRLARLDRRVQDDEADSQVREATFEATMLERHRQRGRG